MHNVFANLWQISSKSGMNKSIARFPDVCLSPPSPPAGPIPIPYPNTSFSTDLKNGSKTVKVGKKPAALAQTSFYKASVLGNEAATRSFGANIITHQITGKTYFKSWSMDVKFEGKNVCRHLDLTTSNHMSDPPGEGVPAPTVEMQTIPGADPEDVELICKCCDSDAHSEAQRKGQTITEAEFYAPKQTGLRKTTVKGGKIELQTRPVTPKEAAALAAGLQDVKDTRASKGGTPDCSNQVPAEPPSDDPCDRYFPITPAEKAEAEQDYLALRRSPAAPASWTASDGKPTLMVAHRVPLGGGGCPVGPNAQPVTDPFCKTWDGDVLGAAQGKAWETRRDHTL